MIVARITKRAFADQSLSGRGAMLYSGRWHSKGTPIAYTASTASLALLELLVHVDRNSIPDDLMLLMFEIPDEFVGECTTLPKRWNATPHAPYAQRYGDRWAARGAVGNATLALSVPSAILRTERNILVNPLHPEFGRIRRVSSRSLAIDSRLFG